VPDADVYDIWVRIFVLISGRDLLFFVKKMKKNRKTEFYFFLLKIIKMDENDRNFKFLIK
jgi:hypothetical protein